MTSEVETARRSAKLFERARAVTPGGVNSPVRAFQAVGGTPRFMVRGAGAVPVGRRRQPVRRPGRVVGADDPRPRAPGRRRGGPRGRRGGAVVRHADRGRDRPRRGDHRRGSARSAAVRLVNSGTEATMSAIRLARGFTGRRKIVKFAGCYHGHVDALLADAGSGVATLGLPTSPGVTGATGRATRSCCPTTTSTPSRAAFAEHGADDRRGDHRGGRRATWARSRRSPASTRACASCAPSTARCWSWTR